MEYGIIYYLAVVFAFLIGVIMGGGVIFFARRVIINRQMHIAEKKADRILAEARAESKDLTREARQETEKIKSGVEAEYRERRAELQRQESQLSQKTESLERKLEDVENRGRNLTNKEKELGSIRTHLEEVRDKQLKQLELISGMSSDEAKQTLIETMEVEMQEESSRRLREWEAKVREEANERAQEILSQVIQRSASEIVSETTVSAVPLPSDEMKGRLIGREGRNIRALEQATGVDLIIDDTPEAVTLVGLAPGQPPST